MRLSCLPVSYFPLLIKGEKSIESWAAEACKLGFDAIDLSIIFLRDKYLAELKKIRKAIEEVGMKVAIINTYPDFTHPGLTERKKST